MTTHQQKVRKQIRRGVLLGALVSLALGTFVGPVSYAFMGICGLTGALTAYVIVRCRLSHLSGMALYGGTGMVFSCLGVYWGLAAGNLGPATLFFVWVLYVVFGAILGIWAETSRMNF